MTLSRIPPQAYIDQDWFERERELLFEPLWQFAALKTMLAQPNAFVTRTLCGVPLVIQNIRGELRAFENVCPHRQNPVQTAPHGVRPLFCGYHGWSFDQDGATAGIPHEEALYRFTPQQRDCLRLRRVALACVGNLVFVNLSAQPLPIEEQLGGAMLAYLEHASAAFDGEVILTTYEGRFNWKLAYENLRDANHARYVHSRTLFQETRFQAQVDERAVAALRKLEADGGVRGRDAALALLRDFSRGGRDAPLEDPPSHPWHPLIERYRDRDGSCHDEYYNWLVFPNIHIASANGGYSFTLEHHIPVGPGRTDMIVYYMTAKKTRPYAASAAVLHSTMLGADKVLREDIDIMENIQRTLHPQAPSPALGDYEAENAIIHRWYLDLMEAKFVL
jgi:phenylpropionate dioxygenase-like ring-hydroxylating dioxygenase large terminal subunit